MKLFRTYSLTFAAMLLVVLAAVSANAQDARLNFEKLNGLDQKARDVVEVNIDGKLLELAKRVTAKVNDENAKKVAQAISGLKGIYVRVYNFENENEYNIADVDEIRNQLNAPGWEKIGQCPQQKE